MLAFRLAASRVRRQLLHVVLLLTVQSRYRYWSKTSALSVVPWVSMHRNESHAEIVPTMRMPRALTARACAFTQLLMKRTSPGCSGACGQEYTDL